MSQCFRKLRHAQSIRSTAFEVHIEDCNGSPCYVDFAKQGNTIADSLLKNRQVRFVPPRLPEFRLRAEPDHPAVANRPSAQSRLPRVGAVPTHALRHFLVL